MRASRRSLWSKASTVAVGDRNQRPGNARLLQDEAEVMESAMANVDLGRYRRIVQMFWDPEPSNDTTQDQPVWCLGEQYQLHSGKVNGARPAEARTESKGASNKGPTAEEQAREQPAKQLGAPHRHISDTTPSLPPAASHPQGTATWGSRMAGRWGF